MTRKHYRKIASIIKDNSIETKAFKNYVSIRLDKDNLIMDLILMFEDDNHLFDRDKFIDACN